MRIALLILIAIHGLIHLFGFFKAFGLAEFNAITQPISKTYGVVWLLVFLFFATTLILHILHFDYWWISGLMAVISSQLLIFNYWSDAKFGSLANLIILIAVLIGYSNFSFRHQIKKERSTLFVNTKHQNDEIVTEQSLQHLPAVIQNWLMNSGTLGKKPISNVHLTQELQLKMKPEQSAWYPGTAEQYFTIDPPAFHWTINTEMNSILSVVGRDQFKEGKGEMLIKLCSLIPVANAKRDEKVNQATLQRYLAEMVWFPSMALSPYITWKSIDQHSARATMEYKGTQGSGVFHFDKDGRFEKLVAMRFQNSTDTKPTPWTVKATKSEVRNGIQIPVECEASWELESGEWTWLKLKIIDIQYDVKEMPVAVSKP